MDTVVSGAQGVVEELSFTATSRATVHQDSIDPVDKAVPEECINGTGLPRVVIVVHLRIAEHR